jgi:hypothetical protein
MGKTVVGGGLRDALHGTAMHGRTASGSSASFGINFAASRLVGDRFFDHRVRPFAHPVAPGSDVYSNAWAVTRAATWEAAVFWPDGNGGYKLTVRFKADERGKLSSVSD